MVRPSAIEGKERLSMIKSAAILVAAMAIVAPAHAQEARVDPEHILTVLTGAGYEAETINQDKGFRQILTKSGDYRFLVEMWDCVDGKSCQTLEFYANVPMEEKPTKERLDAYSGPREGARISIDRRGDAVIRQELDINAPGGINDEQFVLHVKTWETVLDRFVTYLAEAPAASATVEAAAEAGAAGPSAPAVETADAT
jgi:hypothetical protein